MASSVCTVSSAGRSVESSDTGLSVSLRGGVMICTESLHIGTKRLNPSFTATRSNSSYDTIIFFRDDPS